MATKPQTKARSQLLGGLLTMALAIGLLIATVVCMTRCAAAFPTPTPGPVTLATDPKPTQPKPTLAPNPYGPGDFGYSDGYLTCLEGESLLGIDVSEHQGIIDWPQVAEAGIQFAMIRAGFRGYGSEGTLNEDICWQQNFREATDAGLQVGVYFFSQAITQDEAREEARFVLSLLNGATLQLPIVFDWEHVSAPDARTAAMTARQLNACALAFCQEIEQAGYDAMVYFNQDQARHMYDLLSLQEAGYPFWLAMYSDTMTFAHKLSMWQYTDGGNVPGISTNVDMNLLFVYLP